jgi:ABC-2 type transport system ATP-binding protein
MNTTAPVVQVENLLKTYGSFTAVDSVSFEIQRGETFALLGPNGAGKSTTIEVLEGYRDRTSGSARVLGVDPGKGGLDWKARLGIVLQSTGESANVTVREQLTHFAGYYPHPRSVDEVISAVSLEEKAGTLIRKLSGGNVDAWMSRSASSVDPRCCSSTNQPRASTPRPVNSFGK